MKLYDIIQAHPNSYVVMIPHERDERDFVASWAVLNQASVLSEAEDLRKIYESEGMADVVIYNTSEPEDGSEAALVAQFFRVFYKMSG